MRFITVLAVLFCLLVSPLAPHVASAGTIHVKGSVLQGRIVALTPGGLIFGTEYGSGDITIPWSDVERVESDREMVLAFGEEGEFQQGRLLAVDGDSILFGESEATAKRVRIDSIYGGFDKGVWNNSLLTRLRARYRYWGASVGVSGSFTEASTNSESLQIDMAVSRKKGPNRIFFDGSYLVASSFDEIDDEHDQQSQRAFAQLRGEHDFSGRAYVFGSQSFEWDRVEELKARVIPRAGAGYRFLERDWGFLSGEVAPAWVYETKREDCGTCALTPSGAVSSTTKQNDFWALSLGSRTEVALPFGSKFTASLDYFPDVENWSAYLVKLRGVFSVPLLDWMSFRLSIDNTHDSDPADDARRNRFTATVGLSVDF